jgi:tetratricopeptide (TPR) repeat protein
METMLASGLKKNYLIKLNDMMPSLAKLKTAEDVQLAYAEVSSMIEYLTQTYGDEIIPNLLNKLAKNYPFDLTITSILGTNLNIFQDNWEKFVREKNLQTIPRLKAPGVQFKMDQSTNEPQKKYIDIENKKSRDHVLLGDILKSKEFYKAAIIEYQRAMSEYQGFSPIFINKLAKTHFITKEFNKAETILKKSLNYYPMFHSTLVSMGELYFNTGNIEKSRDFYERAIQINPFNPYVHTRLITIYKKLENKKEEELQKKLFKYIDR